MSEISLEATVATAQARHHLESAGAEFSDTLRQALAKAAAAYEQRTGSVVTRVECYRKGVDWSIEASAMRGVEATQKEDMFT